MTPPHRDPLGKVLFLYVLITITVTTTAVSCPERRGTLENFATVSAALPVWRLLASQSVVAECTKQKYSMLTAP